MERPELKYLSKDRKSKQECDSASKDDWKRKSLNLIIVWCKEKIVQMNKEI